MARRSGDPFRKRCRETRDPVAGGSPGRRSAKRNVFFSGKRRKKCRKTAGRRKSASVPGDLHDVVDPVVAGRAQPADEELHEEDAQDVEDLDRGVVGAPRHDEDAEDEEQEAEEDEVVVRRRAEPVGREGDLRLEDVPAAPHEVVHLLADAVPAELRRRIGRLVEHVVADPEDDVAGLQARPLRGSARDEVAHEDAPRRSTGPARRRRRPSAGTCPRPRGRRGTPP